MTIHLQPDEERIVNEALGSGQYNRAEDVISEALAAWRRQRSVEAEPAGLQAHLDARNLAELFANSPFRGLDMEFERDRDLGRDFDL